MLRVIAGKYKRSNLETLSGDDITRPSKDQLKEGLFSSINIRNDDSFLDLFAGSGAVGIEAISRGAKQVYFNDANKEAYKVIKRNLAKFDDDSKVFNLDYKNCLSELKGKKFDYIFCDPPYAFDQYSTIFALANENTLLASTGIMIVEVHKNTTLQEIYGPLHLYKERKYGIAKILYYRASRDD